MSYARPLWAVVGLLFLVLLIVLSVWITPALGNAGSVHVVGTDHDDLIILGPQTHTVELINGDHLLIGGAGDNLYRLGAGSGHTTLIEASGHNVVEFGAGITFSDVASGLWISGEDLRLVIGSEQRTLTVRDFFAVQDTIALFRFDNGEQLTAAQLFPVFGRQPPSAPGPQRILHTQVDETGLLQGTADAEVLVPAQPSSRVQGRAGDDLLIGRVESTVFEFFPGDGRSTLIASSGEHVLLFRGGIHFNTNFPGCPRSCVHLRHQRQPG